MLYIAIYCVYIYIYTYFLDVYKMFSMLMHIYAKDVCTKSTAAHISRKSLIA